MQAIVRIACVPRIVVLHSVDAEYSRSRDNVAAHPPNGGRRPGGGGQPRHLCYNHSPAREARPALASLRQGSAMATNEFTLTQTQTEPGTSALAFVDADGCAAWVRALPLTNIPNHFEAILDQLRRLSEADVAPRERARIAEVMREPVMFLHTELARRYAGKPQPAAEREREAFVQALALWQASVEPILRLPQAAAGKRSRSAGRQGQGAAARVYGSASSSSSCTVSRDSCPRPRSGRSCMPTIGSPRSSNVPSPR